MRAASRPSQRTAIERTLAAVGITPNVDLMVMAARCVSAWQASLALPSLAARMSMNALEACAARTLSASTLWAATIADVRPACGATLSRSVSLSSLPWLRAEMTCARESSVDPMLSVQLDSVCASPDSRAMLKI